MVEEENAQSEDVNQFERVLERMQTEKELQSENPEFVKQIEKYERAVLILREYFFDSALAKVKADREMYPDDEKLADYEEIIQTLKAINAGLVKEKMGQTKKITQHTRIISNREKRERKLEDKVRERDEEIEALQKKLDEQVQKTFKQAGKASAIEEKYNALKQDMDTVKDMEKILELEQDFEAVFAENPDFVRKTEKVDHILEAWMLDPDKTRLFEHPEGRRLFLAKLLDAYQNREAMDGKEMHLETWAGDADTKAKIATSIVELIFDKDFYKRAKKVFERGKQSESKARLAEFVSKEFGSKYVPKALLDDEKLKKETADKLLKKNANELIVSRMFYKAVTQILIPEKLKELEEVMAQTEGIESNRDLVSLAISKIFTRAISDQDADLIKSYRSTIKTILTPKLYDKIRHIRDPKKFAEAAVALYKQSIGRTLKKVKTDALETAKSETTTLQTKLSEADKKRIAELENIVEDLEQNLYDEKEKSAKIPEYEAEISRLKGELAQAKPEELAELQERITKLETERKDAITQAQTQRLALWKLIPEEFSREVSGGVLSREFITERSEEGDTQEVSFDVIKAAMIKLLEENAQRREKIASLNDKLDELTEEKDGAEEELRKITAENKGLESYKTGYEKKTEQVTELEDKLIESQGELAEAKGAIIDLEHEKETQFTELQEQISAATHEKQELDKKYSAQIAELNQQLDSLKQAKEESDTDYTSQIGELQEKLDTVTREKEEKEAELNAEIKELREEYEKIKNFENRDFVSREKYDEDIGERDEKIEELQRASPGDISEETLQEKLSEQEAELRGRYDPIFQANQELEQQIASLEGQITELKDKKEAVEGELEELKGKYSQLEQDKSDLEGSASSEKTEQAVKIADLESQMEALRQELEEKNVELEKAKANAYDSNTDMKIKDHQALKEKEERLREQYRTLQGKNTTLELDLQNANSKLEEKKSYVGSLEGEISELKEQKRTAETELNDLKEKYSALERDKAVLDEAVTADETEQAEKLAELESQVESLQNQIGEKESELEEAKSEYEQKEQEHTVYVQTVEEEKQGLTEKITSLNTELAKVKDKFNTEQERFNTTAGQMQKEKEQAEQASKLYESLFKGILGDDNYAKLTEIENLDDKKAFVQEVVSQFVTKEKYDKIMKRIRWAEDKMTQITQKYRTLKKAE